MVNYWLMITAEFENVATLQPQGGCDDPSFTYFFKMKCGSCGELTDKETCVALERSVQIPGSKGTANLVQKAYQSVMRMDLASSKHRVVPIATVAKVMSCKFCEREGTVSLIPGKGKPLTQELSEAGKYTGLMMFDCRGYEPVGFLFEGGWMVETAAGTKFEDIDLSDGEFMEYDEKGKCSVMISNLKSGFVVAKGK
ncbi:unnamed protein product [Linum tenue]|uniref:Uncharacterized protein n=1 Tax=Linum tenue TaxID=586396 RepID=A0AAV0JEC1_9ROSI|nr:unnamed protein product [Linum tenue]CAI0409110.1 unnamed protein product [Linum tenue]